MTKYEVFVKASAELGETTANELSQYIEAKYGVSIPAIHIPIFQATLRYRKDHQPVVKSTDV
jgi:hypothetical protein